MIDKKKELVACGQQFYERRWMWGTAGNLSIRLKEKPLEIAITPSGLNKGHLTTQDLLILKDGQKPAKHPKGHIPSAETVIHQEIYRALPGCGAVFHVHAMFATILSRRMGHPTKATRFQVEWFEMMKGVGVGEEESAEIMVVPNSQDVSLIAKEVRRYIDSPDGKVLPAVLIYNHGLTAWGKTTEAARNHLEIMEYVCQYLYLRNIKDNS